MLNPLDLSGRTILVAGASSGIGRETAVLVSQLGGRVILVARDAGRLEQTRGQLVGTGHEVRVFDLTAFDELASWLKGVAAEVGPVHGLVHSAGVHLVRPLRFLGDADLHQVMRTNVHAAVGLVRAFRQKGVCASDGSVVLVSSVTGLVGQSGVAAYAASKGAIVALTKSLAVELAREGLRINCVAPGLVQTAMTNRIKQQLTEEQFTAIQSMHPLGVGTARDVAHAVTFLLADTGRWITGSTLVVDGGYTAH